MKYVLIISDDKEMSTDHVIDWLNYYKAKYIRLSRQNIIRIKRIKIGFNNTSFELYYKTFDNKVAHLKSEDLLSSWYRRSIINLEIPNLKNNTNDILNELFQSNQNENTTTREFIDYYLKFRLPNSISNYQDNDQNKLINLFLAKEIGLKTPDTIISSLRSEVQKFNKLFADGIITKPSAQGAPFGEQSKLNLYTTLLTFEEINQMPESFPVSCFQENIPKLFEIRVFYLNRKMYSMAIFSQNDSQTKVDFRDYNSEKPNRTVPFKLPKKIKLLLIQYMDMRKLNCGSIDLLVNEQKEYVFLEVNPVGQFQQVSSPCNYKLEKLIAKKLINS